MNEIMNARQLELIIDRLKRLLADDFSDVTYRGGATVLKVAGTIPNCPHHLQNRDAAPVYVAKTIC